MIGVDGTIATVAASAIAVGIGLLNSGQVVRLRHKLERRASEDDRAAEREEVVARYRQPLAMAAFDCHRRLHHILTNDFLAEQTRRGTARRDLAVRTTVYRFAQYFCWAEILRQEIQLLAGTSGDTTARTHELMNRLIKVFMANALDCPGFEIWRDQQRSIGELMIDTSGPQRRCIGYFAFDHLYESRFEKWCNDMTCELESPGGDVVSVRLQLAQHLFCELACHLDPDGLQYRPWWHKKAELPLSIDEAERRIALLDVLDP